MLILPLVTELCENYVVVKECDKIRLILCAIDYHLYNLNSVKNIHRGVLLLVKLQVTYSSLSVTE